MTKAKGIAIVGAGNIAWHIGFKIKNAGIPICGIYNRTVCKAKELAKELNTDYSGNFSDIPKDCDLVLLCISDSFVKEVANAISMDLPVAHTSGSMPLSIISGHARDAGVFYPFQTFSKDINTGLIEFPVCIEYTSTSMREKLEFLANMLSNNVLEMNSEKRKLLHLSGVFANNFSNHLVTLATEFLNNNGMDTNLLVPLMKETLNKAILGQPRDVQTGPAVRGNQEVIESHLVLLEDHKNMQSIYEIMSQSIVQYYRTNNNEF